MQGASGIRGVTVGMGWPQTGWGGSLAQGHWNPASLDGMGEAGHGGVLIFREWFSLLGLSPAASAGTWGPQGTSQPQPRPASWSLSCTFC